MEEAARIYREEAVPNLFQPRAGEEVGRHFKSRWQKEFNSVFGSGGELFASAAPAAILVRGPIAAHTTKLVCGTCLS
jgi:hypothetical protein